MKNLPNKHILNEKDSCGIGFVANIKGQASKHIIDDALTMLVNMQHRSACGCEENRCLTGQVLIGPYKR